MSVIIVDTADNSVDAVSQHPPIHEAARSPWPAFAVVLTAVILNILDTTIVNVAAPVVQRDLQMSTASLEWISAAYTLALAAGLMTGGRLGDMLGRRRMLLIGLSGFVLASLACALAPTGAVLIGSRAAQGLAAAMMVPQGFGLIREIFGAERAGFALGVMGPIIGLSTVLGPVVAGGLLQADIAGTEWRAAFLINLPIGGLALIAGIRLLPRVEPSHRGHRLDLLGTVLFAGLGVLLVYPLVEGRMLGWPVWVIALMVAALPVAAVFMAQQKRRLAAGHTPLLETSVLRKPSYVAGIGFLMVFFGCVVGLQLVMGVFLQLGLGQSPMHAGLSLAALAAGTFLGAGVGSWAATAVGRPILHVGLSLMALGCIVLWATLHHVGASVTSWQLSPGLAIFGTGMGMIFVPLFNIVLGDVEDHELGSATGLLTSVEQLGAAIGVAVLATAFFHVFDVEDGGPAAAVAAGRHVAAAEHTLLIVVALTALAWALGWLLPRRGTMGAAH